MPSGLQRFQHAHQTHFVTFTCYHRYRELDSPAAKELFEHTLERVRRWYGISVYGYVVMPEHVHLLVSEPERGELATALQMLKQIVSRKRHAACGEPFWQRRYYDFNVWSERKFREKLRYIHRNPMRRGLVDSPEDWPWSSFRHYLTGVEATVEIESEWTARKRERMGILPRVEIRHLSPNFPPFANSGRKGGPPATRPDCFPITLSRPVHSSARQNRGVRGPPKTHVA